MKDNEKIEKYPELTKELQKKAVEHKSDPILSCYALNCQQGLEKETGGIWDQRKNREYPDHSTVDINENSSKSTKIQSDCSHSDFSKKKKKKVYINQWKNQIYAFRNNN